MNPKVALVLSGGGARGLAHIGVVKVLAEAQVPVDLVVGTSMGGLVGAAYAAGLSADQMRQIALDFAQRRNFVGFADPPGRWALLRGRRLIRWLEANLGKRTFAELERPLVLVAADLVQGTEVHFDQGPLADALRATIAIPGFLDPVEDQGRLLADGGVLNVWPTDVARARGAEVIVGVLITPAQHLDDWHDLLTHPLVPKSLRRTALSVARAADLLIARQAAQQQHLAPAEVTIVPDLPPGVTMITGFHRVDELIAAGEAAAKAALPQIWDHLR